MGFDSVDPAFEGAMSMVVTFEAEDGGTKEVIKSSAPAGGEIVIEFRIIQVDLEIINRPSHYMETDPF